MKTQILIFVALIFISANSCKKKAKVEPTTITAEQIAGKYLWLDYQSDAGQSGTFKTLFTSCESCNQNDTLVLKLNGTSSIAEAGSPCGTCSYSMIFNSTTWSIKDNNQLNLLATWSIESFKDSLLELKRDDGAGTIYKVKLRKVNPQPPKPVLVTIDDIVGSYLWDDFSRDVNRTGNFVSQFTSCESCNQNDTIKLIKAGGCVVVEAGTPCGPCSYSMVLIATSWSILNSSTINFNSDVSRNWVITKFVAGMLEIKNDNGAPNSIATIRLKKVL